jgi:hypothetical protein
MSLAASLPTARTPRRPTIRVARPSVRMKALGGRYVVRAWVDPEDMKAVTPESTLAYIEGCIAHHKATDAAGCYHVFGSREHLGTLDADLPFKVVATLLRVWLCDRFPNLDLEPPFLDADVGNRSTFLEAWRKAADQEDVTVFRGGRAVAVLRATETKGGYRRIIRLDGDSRRRRPLFALKAPAWAGPR